MTTQSEATTVAQNHVARVDKQKCDTSPACEEEIAHQIFDHKKRADQQ